MEQKILTVALLLSASANAASCQLSAYSCLASNVVASAYCSSALNTAAQDAVTSMYVISRTTTLSNVPTSTVTITSTESIISRSTATTFVTSSSKAAARRRRKRATSCDTSEDILSGLNNSQLSEACSCIGALPTVEAALKTVAQSTKVVTGEVWFTVAPEVTTSVTRTVSTMAVETVESAAPSFTQIWGPKEGCDDIGRFSVQSYMSGSLSEDEVTDICKKTCINLADCVVLFVQSVYPKNNFYNCYFNNHTFDEDSDLECGKDTSKWGSGKGHSVIGRG